MFTFKVTMKKLILGWCIGDHWLYWCMLLKNTVHIIIF